MKKLVQTLSNTYKAVRLLSNPAFAELLEQKVSPKEKRGNSFYHKHYIVQVMN